MQRTLVSLSGLVVAALAIGLGAGVVSGAEADGHAGHRGTAHVQRADGKSPTGTGPTAAATILADGKSPTGTVTSGPTA